MVDEIKKIVEVKVHNKPIWGHVQGSSYWGGIQKQTYSWEYIEQVKDRTERSEKCGIYEIECNHCSENYYDWS